MLVFNIPHCVCVPSEILHYTDILLNLTSARITFTGFIYGSGAVFMFPEFLINADWSLGLLIFGPQKTPKAAHKNMIRTVFPFWAELIWLW